MGCINVSPKSDKTRYLFKITVVGPEDKLLEELLSTFDDPVVAVDGIRIGSTEVAFDSSEVHAVFMSPKHSALDILLALTYRGASGVIIVLREPDPELEAVYRNEIRKSLGTKIPTQVVTISSEIDDFKKQEIHHIFDEMIAEILEMKTKAKKSKPASKPKPKAATKTSKKTVTKAKTPAKKAPKKK